MEVGDICLHIIRCVGGCPQLRVAGSLSLLQQLLRTVDVRENGFGGSNQFLEKLPVFFTGPASGLVGQILFQLPDIGRHFLWMFHLVVKPAGIQFNHIPEKQNQGLGIHGHVVHADVKPLVPIRHFNHYNMVHGGIVPLKGNLCPLPELLLRVLLLPAGKVKVFDFLCLLLHHILVDAALLVMGKAQAHGIAAGNGLLNAAFKHVPV